jgi:polyribonucleotide nucleotidyltransferase
MLAVQSLRTRQSHKVEIWGGQPLTLETGKIARQADGAVLATYGETVVLATVVSAKEPKPGRTSSR